MSVHAAACAAQPAVAGNPFIMCLLCLIYEIFLGNSTVYNIPREHFVKVALSGRVEISVYPAFAKGVFPGLRSEMLRPAVQPCPRLVRLVKKPAGPPVAPCKYSLISACLIIMVIKGYAFYLKLFGKIVVLFLEFFGTILCFPLERRIGLRNKV